MTSFINQGTKTDKNIPVRLELKDRNSIEKEACYRLSPQHLLKRQLCVCIGLRGQVQERGSREAKSRDWLATVRERTGVANATIKLDPLYSVARTHVEMMWNDQPHPSYLAREMMTDTLGWHEKYIKYEETRKFEIKW